ncbi:MAG: InlB B-repeat-containing protein, partial [Clostridiales bacterium]|nr:InlB B-repeat-containing protein [Clostridiales bacterium]
STQRGGVMLISSYGNVQADLYNAELYENTAGSLGGGICVYSGSTLTMHGGRVYDNTAATSGGGIATYAAGTTLSILGGQITGNTANSTAAGGGGVYLAADTDSVIDGALIDGNTARCGGGLYTDTASATVSQTSIRENRADNGGGIYVTGTASLKLHSATVISANRAAENGGGIFTEDCDYSNPADEDKYANLLIEESTLFSGNTAGQAYQPPVNALNFPHLGYGRTSLGQAGAWYHPLNNYDINYEDPLNPLALYTVTYEANGGEGGHTDINLPEGGAYRVLDMEDTGITRPGYTFLGWNTRPDGLGEDCAPRDSITITQDMTLYAIWEAAPQENTLSVVYDANGGDGSYGDYELAAGTDYTVRNPDTTGITRSCYTFLGWNTRPDGAGEAYRADEQIVLTQSLTLYAQWQAEAPPAQDEITTAPSSCAPGNQTAPAVAPPKTGDAFHLPLWAAVSGFAALTVLTAAHRKKNRRDSAQ